MDTGPTIGESPHPVSVHERIDLIDVVRGFALFGVLLANLVWITTDVEEAGILGLAFAYLSVLVLLFHRSTTWRRRLGYLAPVGRMALTNYLTQSVLYLILFTGVGFGLYGEVGPAWCVGLAVIIFAAQMAFSAWWLARYRFGPAEWVWRTLTYGQLQPMRVC